MSKDKKTNQKNDQSNWIDPHAAREADKYENPVPSRELMLEHLENCDEPATHMELVDVFKLTSEDQIEAIRRRLIAMCRDKICGRSSEKGVTSHRAIGHRKEGYGSAVDNGR